MTLPENFDEMMRAGVRVEIAPGLYIFKSLSDRVADGDVSHCDVGAHEYEPSYYGHKCTVCGDFIPDGCEPWMPLEDSYERI